MAGDATIADGEYRKVKVLVVGAGPTGLGAATRLNQLGEKDWLLVDQAEGPGGLACTRLSREGFHFDMGGHVIFSHFTYFDELLDVAVGTGDEHWDTHQRVSYVIMRGQRIPYPFQFNIRYLPKDEVMECIMGLIDQKLAAAKGEVASLKNFDDWIRDSFGKGIADVFMRPYNFKVWAVPPQEMSFRWIGERVATVDVERVIRNVVEARDDASWGPNATFRFPRWGGTGAIWKAVAGLLPKEKQLYNKALVSVDADKKVAVFSDGTCVQYESMISTMPADLMCNMVGLDSTGLVYSSTHVIGFGFRGTHSLSDICWMYFPEDNCPFYRATVFSNYSPHLTPEQSELLPTLEMGDGGAPTNSAPQAGPYWSLMLEVSESAHKPVEQETLLADCLRGCLATGLICASDEVVSRYHTRLERGYPTPSVGREEALEQILPWLQQRGIYSRGRFGAWRYEVANQDHSLMQGVEAAGAVVAGHVEYTVAQPGLVNQMKAPVNSVHYLSQEGNGESEN